MSIEEGLDPFDEEASGYRAIGVLMTDFIENPDIRNETLSHFLKDPLYTGIFYGFDCLRGNASTQASDDMVTGLLLSLTSYSRRHELAFEDIEIDSFVPDDLSVEMFETRLEEHDKLMAEAGASVVHGVITDTIASPEVFRERYNQAMENPACKGINKGFGERIPMLIEAGFTEDSIYGVQIGLALGLIAISAPYDMLLDTDFPDFLQ